MGTLFKHKLGIFFSLGLAALIATGCGDGSSSSSGGSSASAKLSAVSGLTATPGNGQNTLTWTAVAGAVSYNIYWDTQSGVTASRTNLMSGKYPASPERRLPLLKKETYAQSVARVGTLISGVSGTSYAHTGLSNGTNYYYLALAVDENGEEGESPAGGGVAEATPEPSSSSSSSSGGSSSGGSHSGGSTSTGESSSGGSSSGGGSSSVDTTPPTTSSWAYSSATDSTGVFSATINENGTGYCAAVPMGSPAPTSSEVIAGSGGSIFGAGGSVALTANTAGSCTVSLLDSFTSYDVYFAAVDSAGNAQTTTAVDGVFTTTAAPTGLAVTPGDTQNTIAWNPDPNAQTYYIYWSTSTGVTTGSGTQIDANGATSYTHTGLTNGTTYYYVVTTFSINGESPATLEANGTPVAADTTPPTTSVWSALVVSQTAMWGAPTIDENGTGYCAVVPAGSLPPSVAEVMAGAGGAIVGTGGTVALSANVANQCYMPNLTANTAYDGYFVAVDTAGNVQAAVSAFYGVSTAP